MTISAISCTASGPMARRPHPRGFDRAVMKLGLALLLWARRRTVRRTVRHAELGAVVAAQQQQLRVAQERALVCREREWAFREHRLIR